MASDGLLARLVAFRDARLRRRPIVVQDHGEHRTEADEERARVLVERLKVLSEAEVAAPLRPRPEGAPPMKKLAAALVTWYEGEPLIAHNVAAFALTVLAHYGVHLDANTTALVGSVLAAAATGLTHRKVTPAPSAPVGESGRITFYEACLGLIALILIGWALGYVPLHR